MSRAKVPCLTFSFFQTTMSITMFSVLIGVTACTRKQEAQNKKIGGELNIAIWSNYLSADMAEKFTAETGIKLNISNYGSNEELLAKVQSGGSGIDVAVPTDYMVDIMTKLNLLERLDKSKIPNLEQVEAKFLAQSYDPNNDYSVPYTYGTTGFAVNRDLFKGELKSWRQVIDTPALAGKISLLDDAREVIGAMLKLDGDSINTTDSAKLAKAKELVIKLRKNTKMFTADSTDPLINKEVAVAQTYSSDGLQAGRKTKGKIEYVVPAEGTTIAADNFVIIKGSKNIEAANAFINFMTTKEAGIKLTTSIMGGPVVKGVREALPEELKNNPSIFPPDAVQAKLEHISDVGEHLKLFEDIWAEVKSSN